MGNDVHRGPRTIGGATYPHRRVLRSSEQDSTRLHRSRRETPGSVRLDPAPRCRVAVASTTDWRGGSAVSDRACCHAPSPPGHETPSIDVSMNACQHVARAQHPDGRWQHDSTQQLIRVTLRSSSPLTTICLHPEPAITIVAFCPSPKPATVWGRPLDHVRPKSVDFALAHWR